MRVAVFSFFFALLTLAAHAEPLAARAGGLRWSKADRAGGLRWSNADRAGGLRWSNADRAGGLHVVFDLDGTLISPASEAKPDDDPRHFVEAGGERYRLQDFAPEVLAALRDAGYKISFFSGGPKERNHAIISHLQKLVRDRTGRALEPFKILNREDLTPVFGRAENARFRDRFRKDLQRIAVPGDVVIVDDLPEMIMTGQERHVLAVSSESTTVRQRQKLLVAMEILLGARETLKRAPLPYLQVVRGLAAGTAPGAGYDDEAYVELLRKALARLDLPMRVNEPSYPIYLRARSCGKVLKLAP